jgi:DNA (cytosine-5)-methyltransferase 1
MTHIESEDDSKGLRIPIVDRFKTEYVLVVPNRLTKSCYQVLIDSNWVPRPWHLEGRYGSRTHKIDERYCGIPILPLPSLLRRTDALKELLTTEGVAIVEKEITISNRIPKLHPIDASIHPERRPVFEQPLAALVNTHFTFIDLFSGIGGFGIALEALGGRCVFASELDEACRTVYAQNMQIASPLYGDIYQIPDLSFPPAKSNIDLLVGGFPCQPFSSLGTQPGLDDERKGQLYLQIVRVLRVSQPKAFLLENVPGLLRMTETFQTIVQALEDAGYQVSTQVCSSRGLTATSRKRLFFVGLRSDMPSGPFCFPFVPDLGLRAVDVIEYDDETTTDMTLLRLSDSQMDQLRHTSKQWKPAKLAWPDVTLDTIDSHYGVTVGKGNSQLVPRSSPNHPRRFSPTECARIMGFPATTFVFLKQSKNQGNMAFLKEQYRMFGNAVCPPIVAAIAGAVIGKCRPDYENTWVVRGRTVAIRLALDALLPSRRDLTWVRLQAECPDLTVL